MASRFQLILLAWVSSLLTTAHIVTALSLVQSYSGSNFLDGFDFRDVSVALTTDKLHVPGYLQSLIDSLLQQPGLCRRRPNRRVCRLPIRLSCSIPRPCGSHFRKSSLLGRGQHHRPVGLCSGPRLCPSRVQANFWHGYTLTS